MHLKCSGTNVAGGMGSWPRGSATTYIESNFCFKHMMDYFCRFSSKNFFKLNRNRMEWNQTLMTSGPNVVVRPDKLFATSLQWQSFDREAKHSWWWYLQGKAYDQTQAWLTNKFIEMAKNKWATTNPKIIWLFFGQVLSFLRQVASAKDDSDLPQAVTHMQSVLSSWKHQAGHVSRWRHPGLQPVRRGH